MQDATGAIVISYQTYLVENRTVLVVDIINVLRYGTPKDGKNHSTITFILIHQEYIIETITHGHTFFQQLPRQISLPINIYNNIKYTMHAIVAMTIFASS